MTQKLANEDTTDLDFNAANFSFANSSKFDNCTPASTVAVPQTPRIEDEYSAFAVSTDHSYKLQNC
jgi:hypothetical protein